MREDHAWWAAIVWAALGLGAAACGEAPYAVVGCEVGSPCGPRASSISPSEAGVRSAPLPLGKLWPPERVDAGNQDEDGGEAIVQGGADLGAPPPLGDWPRPYPR